MAYAIPAAISSHQLETGVAKMKQVPHLSTRLFTLPFLRQFWPSWLPGSAFLHRVAPRRAALGLPSCERVSRSREDRRDADVRVISGV